MGAKKLEDIAAAAGVRPRTVRHWIQQGVLVAPEFRGTRTTYGDDFLVRVRAVQRLRLRNVRLEEIRRRMANASLAEIDQMGRPDPLDDTGTPVPDVERAAVLAIDAAAASAPALAPGFAPASVAERWDRVALLPGLELHLKSDASPVVRRLAQEICAQYGPAAESD